MQPSVTLAKRRCDPDQGHPLRSSMAGQIIDRVPEIDLNALEKGITNSWKWHWLEKNVGEERVSSHIRKLNLPGVARCKGFKLYFISRNAGKLTS